MIKYFMPLLKLLLELIKKKIKSRLAVVPAADKDSKKIVAAGMREGIQTDFPHEVLRRFGCYFFALMKWLEIKNGARFSNEGLILVFESAQAAGFIRGDNAFVVNAVALLNLALGQNLYTDIRRDLSKAPPDGTAIRRLVRNSGNETHFTLQINGVEWDTLDPARPAAGTWSFHSFRVPA